MPDDAQGRGTPDDRDMTDDPGGCLLGLAVIAASQGLIWDVWNPFEISWPRLLVRLCWWTTIGLAGLGAFLALVTAGRSGKK